MKPEETIQFEGGEILANLEDRTITGLLLPFGEEGRTNIGRFQVEAGAVELPADPEVIGINVDHDRPSVVGRATKVWQTDRGVMATFKLAKTEAGDAALKDATSKDGKRRKLSAEFGPAVIKAGKLLTGHAKLWGAALVEEGAFPSAQVLAADTEDPLVEPESQSSSRYVSEFTDEDGVKWRRVDETSSTSTVTKIEDSEAAPAEDAENEKGDSEMEPQVAAGAPAKVPNTLGAAKTNPRPVETKTVLAAIASFRAKHDDESRQVLAALSDIKLDGSGALPATDVLRPNWLGPLEAGVPYTREYIGLGNLGTDISAAGKKGFKVHRGTVGSPIASAAGIPNGGNWAGNKTEINSYAGFTETASSFMRRFSVGHDIGREFYDLPGGTEVIEAFLKLTIEDHLDWSDRWALYDIVTAAGVPVAASSSDYPTDYPAALGQLIQGILAVKAKKADGRRDVPTFAIANDEAYKALVYAAGGEQHLPAFVSIAVSTASSGTVDGAVQIVQGDTGISGSASVIVGSKKAIDFDELAGGPLIINALELANGGIDRAVHGYLQTFHVRSEAVTLIGTPENRANATAYPLGRLIKASSVIYRVTTAGTSDSSAPTAPAVGATVADGTAVLTRLA